MFRQKVLVVALFLLVATRLFPPPVQAQITGATLSGIITDPSQSIIPAANVLIVNSGTGQQRIVKTNANGFFTAADLPAGFYDITVTAQGFATQVEKHLELTVGGARELDAKLIVGGNSERVEVTSLPGDVEVDTSIVSATVGQQRIVDLPLNGRDWTQLATLQPGVSNVRSQQALGNAGGFTRGVRGFGAQITANGHSPYENTYRIDGINENDYSNGAPGSPAGVNLGVDAIQEFNVITTAYTAEYGRTSGAVINAITRSGTNQFHGSAYLFDRDKIFDAESPLDRTVGKPSFHREQFGGSLGGPIRKNKTFLFFNYEGLRQSLGQTSLQIVPSLAARSGNIHNAGGGPLTVTVNPIAAKYLLLFPIPATTNAGCFNDCGNVFITGHTSTTENFLQTRFDQTLSAKDTLSLTYVRDNAPTTTPDLLANTLSLLNAGRQVAAVTETRVITPNLLNIVRLGYNRSIAQINAPIASLTPEAADTTVGYFPGLAAPLLYIAGFTQGVGGYASSRNIAVHDNFFQVYEDVSYSHGRNSLKVGFAYERIQGTASSAQANGTATFATLSATATALANFLQARPYAIDVLPPAGAATPIEPQDNLFGGYAQDDLRVGKRLVLNLGLRYEMLTIPTDRRNRIGLITSLTAPRGSAPCPPTFVATTSPGCTVPVSQFFQTNPTTHDFEPRVGFSYNPFGDGSTAIRGGFGIYDQLPLPYIYATYSAIAYPYAQDQVLIGTVPAGSFPFGDAAVAAANTSSHIGRYIDPHPKRDYSSNYNLNVEQQYGRHMSSLVGYVGSHSIHLPFQASELDQVAPSQVQHIEGRYVYPTNGITATGVKQDVNAQTIFGNLFDGAAHYNSLISQLKISEMAGLTFQATYTFSKCIDYGSSTQAPTTYQNSVPGLTYYNMTQRKGACDYDLPQKFSTNLLYELPASRHEGLVGKLTSGYQVGTIVFASSGVPFTVVQNGDVVGQGGLTYASFPDVVAGCNPYNRNFKTNGLQYLNSNCFKYPTVPLGDALVPLCNQQGTTSQNGQVLCTNIQGNERRNSLVGPKLVEADISLIKNTRVTRISEVFNLQLRAEAFNIFNHANFQAPTDNFTLGTAAYKSTFNATSIGSAGTIDTLAAPVRQLQFGAKVIF